MKHILRVTKSHLVCSSYVPFARSKMQSSNKRIVFSGGRRRPVSSSVVSITVRLTIIIETKRGWNERIAVSRLNGRNYELAANPLLSARFLVSCCCLRCDAVSFALLCTLSTVFVFSDASLHTRTQFAHPLSHLMTNESVYSRIERVEQTEASYGLTFCLHTHAFGSLVSKCSFPSDSPFYHALSIREFNRQSIGKLFALMNSVSPTQTSDQSQENYFKSYSLNWNFGTYTQCVNWFPVI